MRRFLDDYLDDELWDEVRDKGPDFLKSVPMIEIISDAGGVIMNSQANDREKTMLILYLYGTYLGTYSDSTSIHSQENQFLDAYERRYGDIVDKSPFDYVYNIMLNTPTFISMDLKHSYVYTVYKALLKSTAS